jgi:hypothetical protein
MEAELLESLPQLRGQSGSYPPSSLRTKGDKGSSATPSPLDSSGAWTPIPSLGISPIISTVCTAINIPISQLRNQHHLSKYDIDAQQVTTPEAEEVNRSEYGMEVDNYN